MKKIGKPNTVEYVYFRFVSWNSPNLQIVSNLTLFKLSKLLSKGIMIWAYRQKKYTKEQLKRNTNLGIITGQVSVMRLDLNSKTKYKHIQRILK